MPRQEDELALPHEKVDVPEGEPGAGIFLGDGDELDQVDDRRPLGARLSS
jgi:hypothetical protein